MDKGKNVGHFIFLGTVYDVELYDSPVEVDKNGRKPLHGQLDMWDKVCRLYRFKEEPETRKSLFHEWTHMIIDWIRSEAFDPPDPEIDQFAELWYDLLDRNGLFVKNWGHILPSERKK